MERMDKIYNAECPDRLPFNFTDLVMDGIAREAERRERRYEKMMYWMIPAGGMLVAGGLIYALHVLGFLGKMAAWFREIDLPELGREIFSARESAGTLWIMILVNAMILLGGFAYFTARASRNQLPE